MICPRNPRAAAVNDTQRMAKPRIRVTGDDTYVYDDYEAQETWERAHPPCGKPPEDNRTTT